MQTTLKARIHHQDVYSVLGLMAQEFCTLKRVLFKRRVDSKELVKDLKREFIASYGITARHFNSIHCEVSALLSSQRELKEGLLKNVKVKKKDYEKKLKNTDSPFKVHQFKRKIAHLSRLAERYTQDLNHPRVCFGSKSLFHKQFYLKENGYQDHAEWKKEWDFARNSEFFLIGSKDESFGNQSCQLLPTGLQLRLTSKVAQVYGKEHCLIPIEFTYNKELIDQALLAQQALSYRFLQSEEGHWYVHVSFDLQEAPQISKLEFGMLGVDLNPDCIAATHVDCYGNLLNSWQIPLDLKGKRSEQRKAILSDAVEQLLQYAKTHRVPITIEELDRAQNIIVLTKVARKLLRYGFPYSLFC